MIYYNVYIIDLIKYRNIVISIKVCYERTYCKIKKGVVIWDIFFWARKEQILFWMIYDITAAKFFFAWKRDEKMIQSSKMYKQGFVIPTFTSNLIRIHVYFTYKYELCFQNKLFSNLTSLFVFLQILEKQNFE